MTRALVRTPSLDDADRLREFVCRLSPQSRYFRFFASVAPPSTSLLRTLCGASGTADILLVTDSRGAVIGHAMAADARVDGQLESNIGLVIADDWQGRGLGTGLLSLLVSRAAARGVSTLVLDVLPANDRMRGIITRRWPDAPAERTRDALIIRPSIGAGAFQGGLRVPERSAA
jgi:GNAT superfamily N-acetyltransferase